MIPLYILGLLIRFGPRHGYKIRKLIGEQLADFTRIKLPVIYYHLENMESSGLLQSRTGREGTRPAKKIYKATKKGILEFRNLLRAELEMDYHPVFASDAVFYFADHLGRGEIPGGLGAYAEKLKLAVKRIARHHALIVPGLPAEMRLFAELIFDHHRAHYRAEIAWAEKAIEKLNGEVLE